MNESQANLETPRWRSHPPPLTRGSIAFRESLAVPFLFTFVFMLTIPMMVDEHRHYSMTSAIVVLVCGILGWLYLLFSIVRAIRAGVSGGRRSAILALVPLAAYALELGIASQYLILCLERSSS